MNRSNLGVRILVVDDDRDTARTLTELLARLGFTSQSITDPTQTLQAVRNFRPHLMLLDLAMPGLSGFSVMRQIREDQTLQQPVIVVASGYCQKSDQEAALAAGAEYFLAKPLSLEMIQNIALAAVQHVRAD